MYITAQQIHNGYEWLPAGSTIEMSEAGEIINILAAPTNDTITYEGVLAPGFVNVHCHTELSHMKGVIPEHTGLVPFLKTIPFHRNDKSEAEKTAARHAAHQELLENGVVAVGDIANTADSLDIRALDKLHFHTFVEALGFSEVNAARSFGFAMQTFEALAAQPHQHKVLKQSITPHAPYSVSSSLFRMIDEHNHNHPISIHNQESDAEDRFYKTKEGAVNELLQALNIDSSFFMPTGKSSLQSYLEWLSPGRPYIFVHNTVTERQDVQYVKAKIREAFWCLCPNANLYIENKLPDVDMLNEEGATICIGTDSLASNHELSVLSELYTIKTNFPHIQWESLLKWATYHGAWALQMQTKIGTIEAGKTPGIINITGLDNGERPIAKRVI